MKTDNHFPTLNIPVLPTRNMVVFPNTTLPLLVGRPVSIEALLRAQEKDGWILIVAPKSSDHEKAIASEDLRLVGTIAKIESAEGDANRGFRVVVRGVARFKVDS